jgi:hypothetical protein
MRSAVTVAGRGRRRLDRVPRLQQADANDQRSLPQLLVSEDFLGEPQPRRYRPSVRDLDWDDLSDPFMWRWVPVPFGIALLVVALVVDSAVLLATGGAGVALVLALLLKAS